MLRTLLALLAVVGFTATVGAQPGNLPLSPGVYPTSPGNPGVPAVIAATARPGQPSAAFFPAVAPLGYYYPAFGGFGYPFGGYQSYGYVAPAQQPVAVDVPRRAEPTLALANEFPATLSLQFPAAAEVWLNGKAVKGEASEDRVLTSPVLRPGDTFTFEVKARWKRGGKEYESARTVTLGPGDRSRLLVVSGVEVK